MIKKDFTLTVQGKKSVLSSPVYLYTGDGGVIIALTIEQMGFKFGLPVRNNILQMNAKNGFTETGVKNASVTVLKPSKEESFEIPYCRVVDDSYLEIVMLPQYIDELAEVGNYYFQIHLFAHDGARVSIPPFAFEIIDTLNPTTELLTLESRNRVGETKLVIDKSDKDGIEKFEKGDVISAQRLNQLVEALLNSQEEIKKLTEEVEKLKS